MKYLLISLMFFALSTFFDIKTVEAEVKPVEVETEDETRGTAAQAQDMVKRAIALFDRDGAKAAFERFTNNPGSEFKHADLYIFVARANSTALLVAHGADPSLIGVEGTSLIDPNGLNIGRAVLNTVTPEGVWVDYGWKDPVSGEILPKSSWVVSHKGYIFACGIYKP